MSATAAATLPDNTTLGARLRSAGEIEPARLPRLKIIGQEWAEAASATLSALAASPISIEFSGLSSIRFARNAQEISGAALAALLTAPGWQDSGFVLADASFIDALAEAFFGGDAGGAVPQGRPLTPIDRSIAELALEKFNAGAHSAFAPVGDLSMAVHSLLERDIGGRLAEALPTGNVRHLLLSFEVKVGSIRSQLRYGVPEGFFGPHRRKLTALPEAPATAVDEDWARGMEVGLEQADLCLRAILDEKQMTLEEVAGFAVGQTIVLGAGLQSLISIECEDQHLFRARVGRSRDAYVVKIEEKVNEAEEFIDDILSH